MRDCPICSQHPHAVDPIRSSFSSVTFQLGVCEPCELGLVLDPRTDFSELYSRKYYEGTGADQLINYVADEVPGSVREIEWNGIVKTVGAIATRRQQPVRDLKLLDWGAGLGGLVRTARANGIQADGHDEGYAATELEAKGLKAPPLPELAERYDVVTAIEVVEHLIDPVSELRSIADCLKPGGFLFITTGNFAKARVPLNLWYYAQIPDVHVTFWSPRAWAKGLGEAGLAATPLPLKRVDPRIVQYKVIKALRKYQRPLMGCLPLWQFPSHFLDRRYGVSDFAIGVKPLR
jgi:2-polyprenyl-3-methyl-5-hydroxy-6-metoxy-1,4-benzoquinol methylase